MKGFRNGKEIVFRCSKNNMDKIHKAGAIIIQDKKMLVTKSFGKEFYITPGGKYEEGENAEQCLRRELMEELQVELKSFSHYKDYYFDSGLYIEKPLQIELYLVDINGEPKVSREIEDMKWLSKDDIKNRQVKLAASFDEFLPDFVKGGLL